MHVMSLHCRCSRPAAGPRHPTPGSEKIMTMMHRARTMIAAAAALGLAVPVARAQGQNAVITGKVSTEFGQPLEAANVFITELSLSRATDAQGNFSLTIPAARVAALANQSVVLRVRAISFIAESRPVRITAGTQTVNFSLKQDVNRLSEVVVTGVVGEGVERSKVPFAIGRVTQEDLPVPALDPVEALAGKVAGVRIGQIGGAPGSTPEIMLRAPHS